MNASIVAVIVFGVMLVAILFGRILRRLLPAHHQSQETTESVKLAMGMAGTMAALLLGLLVNSAKGTYDSERNEVSQIGANVAFLDRLLELYGPEAAGIRPQLRIVVEDATRQIWVQGRSQQAKLFADAESGNALNSAIHRLSPQNEEQRSVKEQISTLTFQLAQMRSLVLTQSSPSVSNLLLLVVVSWFVLIYVSFSMVSPPNATANIAMIISAFTVSGAIFLILELDRPFSGLMEISSEPILNAVSQLK